MSRLKLLFEIGATAFLTLYLGDGLVRTMAGLGVAGGVGYLGASLGWVALCWGSVEFTRRVWRILRRPEPDALLGVRP